MTLRTPRKRLPGPALAILAGLLGGLGLLLLVHLGVELGGPRIDHSGRLAITINGVPERMARDVLLPESGWALQVRLPEDPLEASASEDAAASVPGAPPARAPRKTGPPDGLLVTLRSERTGATIRIEDRFVYHDGVGSLVIPKALGLTPGLFSIRAIYETRDGRRFEDTRRIRIRSWLGGPPIGTRQVIFFDFGIDRNGDGVPDFLQDLERFGLASNADAEGRELARIVANRIEARALERVARAYDPPDDPNQTGRERDPVRVRFRLDPDPDPASLTTRICVGGSDPTGGTSVGHVHFDLRNQLKFSTECGDDPPSGLFPTGLMTYRDAPLFQETFGPFMAERGGVAIGEDPLDPRLLIGPERVGGRPDIDAEEGTRRKEEIERAIALFGDVLGSIMAHEAGHALGLVAEGRPAVGLFGGREREFRVHNLDAFGQPETTPWLMNAGRTLRFEELAGRSPGGPLRFRPLNYAYLRDRIVVPEGRP
ncbi:MAG TPA: hypothetical protein ENI85_02450 [Deltaproteobacteria bacterium]|nr:hypothetical protein [Deltaproteobacteria bacterium]